jgi:hypothetical protein
MSLTLATLIPGLLLLALGLPLLLASASFGAMLKGFPRSSGAAGVCFGAGSAWFLYNIWNLSSADFGDYRTELFVGFLVIAALAFKCAPDFLAVRGACVIVLLGAMPLLDSAYMQYDIPQRLFMVGIVYVFIVLALWLGAQPYRLRDFIEWLFARPGRSRGFGALVTAYGLLLCGVSLSY